MKFNIFWFHILLPGEATVKLNFLLYERAKVKLDRWWMCGQEIKANTTFDCYRQQCALSSSSCFNNPAVLLWEERKVGVDTMEILSQLVTQDHDFTKHYLDFVKICLDFSVDMFTVLTEHVTLAPPIVLLMKIVVWTHCPALSLSQTRVKG